MPFYILILCFLCTSALATDNTSIKQQEEHWNTYPSSLPQFDYSGDRLQQHWSILAAGTGLPWPNVDYIKSMMLQFPYLSEQLLTLARKETSHPALKPILNNNFLPLSLALQEVWRLHFQGQFQQAYDLGMTLGPAGLLPALYSKLIHSTFLITDTEEKTAKFVEVEHFTAPLIPHAKTFSFLLFGDAYQKARRLELMSTTEATASGLLGPTQETLRELHHQDTDNILYSAMLAGIDGGIIERVGGFIGGLTYGADEEKAIALFDHAITKEKRLAVLYNEFALLLIRLDDADYGKKLNQLLDICTNLKVYSAEEALNQDNCKQLQTAQEKP